MSLSDKKVLDFLSKYFVCGWRNIKGKEHYAGKSHDHACNNPAVDTTNGAGSHNIQMLIVSPEQKVLHCLPGYWKPQALLHELKFSAKLLGILRKPRKHDNERNDEFLLAHLNHASSHTRDMRESSHLQGFDESKERKKGNSDFMREACDSVKTVDQVVHERMAERPFLSVHDFDIGTFVDIGKKFYDAHRDCKHVCKTKPMPKK